jgi:hypothetical protein
LRDALHGESGQFVIEKKHTQTVARQRFACEYVDEPERESSQIHVGFLTFRFRGGALTLVTCHYIHHGPPPPVAKRDR